MDRERKNNDTLPGSLQSLRGEYAEIQQIYWERRSEMPQAQVTMDVRKINERLFTSSLTEHYRNIFQTFVVRPDATRKASRLTKRSLCIQVRGTRILGNTYTMLSYIRLKKPPGQVIRVTT